MGQIAGVNEPVSVATIREVLCDAQGIQILIGNAGEIHCLRKSQRFFPPPSAAPSLPATAAVSAFMSPRFCIPFGPAGSCAGLGPCLLGAGQVKVWPCPLTGRLRCR